MSPIHHHFELAGWPEFTVIVRFWIIAGLCVAVGLGLFYADFISRGGLGMTGGIRGPAGGRGRRGRRGRRRRRGARRRGRRRARERVASRGCARRASAPARARASRSRPAGTTRRTWKARRSSSPAPGVPQDAPILALGAGRRHPRVGRARAGGPAVQRSVPGRHRDERQDDDDRADRRRACAPAATTPSRLRQHRPSVPAGGARGPRRAGRRGVLVPAAIRRDVPSAGVGAAEPRARPPGLARLGARRTSTRNANILRAQGEGDTHVGNRDDARAAVVSPTARRARWCGSRWRRPTTARSATSTATLVSRVAGSESPRARRRRTRRVPRGRRRRGRRVARVRRLARRDPARHRELRARCIIAARSSRSSTACASWTTRRRRTCTRRSRRSTGSGTRC